MDDALISLFGLYLLFLAWIHYQIPDPAPQLNTGLIGVVASPITMAAVGVATLAIGATRLYRKRTASRA